LNGIRSPEPSGAGKLRFNKHRAPIVCGYYPLVAFLVGFYDFAGIGVDLIIVVIAVFFEIHIVVDFAVIPVQLHLQVTNFGGLNTRVF
jgi:hypothetical protein